MEQTPQTTKKNIQLTTKQGLLLLTVIVIGFIAIIVWTSSQYPQSYSGSVTSQKGTLVPFGCQASNIGANLTMPLRPEPAPEGFNEENRAVIVTVNLPSTGSDLKASADVASLSWRNEQKEVVPLTCSQLSGSVDLLRKRVGGIRNRRQNLWTGSVDATCNVPGLGEAAIKLEMKNCD